MTVDEIIKLYESATINAKEGRKLPIFIFNPHAPDDEINKFLNKSAEIVGFLLSENERLREEIALKEEYAFNFSFKGIHPDLKKKMAYFGEILLEVFEAKKDVQTLKQDT